MEKKSHEFLYTTYQPSRKIIPSDCSKFATDDNKNTNTKIQKFWSLTFFFLFYIYLFLNLYLMTTERIGSDWIHGLRVKSATDPLLTDYIISNPSPIRWPSDRIKIGGSDRIGSDGRIFCTSLLFSVPAQGGWDLRHKWDGEPTRVESVAGDRFLNSQVTNGIANQLRNPSLPFTKT